MQFPLGGDGNAAGCYCLFFLFSSSLRCTYRRAASQPSFVARYFSFDNQANRVRIPLAWGPCHSPATTELLQSSFLALSCSPNPQCATSSCVNTIFSEAPSSTVEASCQLSKFPVSAESDDWRLSHNFQPGCPVMLCGNASVWERGQGGQTHKMKMGIVSLDTYGGQ